MFATIQVSEKNGGGGYQILFGSAICSFLMFIILLYQKRNAWTLLEGIMILLIFICVSSWIIKGPYEAVALGIISESIVGIYLFIKTIQKPVIKYNLIGYSLFLLASIVATIDAKDWSLPEVGYSLSEVFITSATIAPLIIRLIKYKRRINF
ncbi:MAG: hypothetical protein WCI91_03740 [Candidatus Nomurabacteria bacterium]